MTPLQQRQRCIDLCGIWHVLACVVAKADREGDCEKFVNGRGC